jgi:hypothetical protein
MAAWLACVALSLQVLMPLGQAIPYTGAGGANGYLIICTALGIQQIPNPDAPPKSDERPTCPVCYSFATSHSMMSQAAAEVVPPSLPVRIADNRSSDQLPIGRAHLAPSSRDPPVV